MVSFRDLHPCFWFASFLSAPEATSSSSGNPSKPSPTRWASILGPNKPIYPSDRHLLHSYCFSGRDTLPWNKCLFRGKGILASKTRTYVSGTCPESPVKNPRLSARNQPASVCWSCMPSFRTQYSVLELGRDRCAPRRSSKVISSPLKRELVEERQSVVSDQ